MFFENLINKLEKALEPNPEVALKVRKVLYEYAVAIGFTHQPIKLRRNS